MVRCCAFGKASHSTAASGWTCCRVVLTLVMGGAHGGRLGPGSQFATLIGDFGQVDEQHCIACILTDVSKCLQHLSAIIVIIQIILISSAYMLIHFMFILIVLIWKDIFSKF